MTQHGGDPGLAFERTTLAWHRTGLSAMAVSALAVHSFQHRLRVAVPVAGLFAVIGIVAYRTGSTSPVSPWLLRSMSLGVSAAAAIAAVAVLSG